jgi:hypothetical protein
MGAKPRSKCTDASWARHRAWTSIYRDDNAVPPLVMTLKEREAVLKVTPVDGVEMVDDEDEGDAEELVS